MSTHNIQVCNKSLILLRVQHLLLDTQLLELCMLVSNLVHVKCHVITMVIFSLPVCTVPVHRIIRRVYSRTSIMGD